MTVHVDVTHPTRFPNPIQSRELLFFFGLVFGIALDDAQGVDPEIADFDLSGKHHRILERFGEGAEGDAVFVRRLRASREPRGHYCCIPQQ